MRQGFILEKSDLELLKSGGIIPLAFPGGTIELKMEAGGTYKPRMNSDTPGAREAVFNFLQKAGKPTKAAEISHETGISNGKVHTILAHFKHKKRIINSDSGWRIVTDTIAFKSKKLAHVNGN